MFSTGLTRPQFRQLWASELSPRLAHFRGKGREPSCHAGPAPSDGIPSPAGEVGVPGAPRVWEADPQERIWVGQAVCPRGSAGGVDPL